MAAANVSIINLQNVDVFRNREVKILDPAVCSSIFHIFYVQFFVMVSDGKEDGMD